MSVIQFVRNYDDLSTDRGYQFKFHCDKCGNGYQTAFQPSVVGTAGSLLRAAGDIFGGWAGSAGNSAYEIQRAVGGKLHDAALGKAVEEGRQYFRQCKRCGRWVCPEVCWNPEASLCDACAPDFKTELAAAQAQAKADAARAQLNEKAQKIDYTGGIDMGADSILRAPEIKSDPGNLGKHCTHCGVSVGNAKFCPECGQPVATAKPACGKCGFQLTEPVKFCPECGNHL